MHVSMGLPRSTCSSQQPSTQWELLLSSRGKFSCHASPQIMRRPSNQSIPGRVLLWNRTSL